MNFFTSMKYFRFLFKIIFRPKAFAIFIQTQSRWYFNTSHIRGESKKITNFIALHETEKLKASNLNN